MPALYLRMGSGLVEAKELILLRVRPLTGRTHQRTVESLSGFRMFLVKEQLGRIAEKLSIARDQSDQSWEKVFLWPGHRAWTGPWTQRRPSYAQSCLIFFLNPKLAIAGILFFQLLCIIFFRTLPECMSISLCCIFWVQLVLKLVSGP